MSNYNFNSFIEKVSEYVDKANGSDTGISDMNRRSNPSSRYYLMGYQNTARPVKPIMGKAIAESPEVQGRPGAGVGALAAGMSADTTTGTSSGTVGMAGVADKTGSNTPTGADGKAEVTAGAHGQSRNKNESCPHNTDIKLNFTNESLLNGIIMAEVLGKPKYFRKGRWS